MYTIFVHFLIFFPFLNQNGCPLELCDVLKVVAASCIAKTPITVSIAADDAKCKTLYRVETGHALSLQFVIQDETSFINDMEKYERIRTCSPEISDAVYKKAAELGKYIATASPLSEGRVEMLHYLKEQSITFEYHRYGSITE